MTRANTFRKQVQSTPPVAEAAAERPFTIGDLAREFGLSLRTLRFYESRGLLVPGRAGRSRHYTSADRVRLQMILKGKRLGFSLTEIAALIDVADEELGEQLAMDAELVLSQIKQLEAQRSEIDQAIEELHRQYLCATGAAVSTGTRQ